MSAVARRTTRKIIARAIVFIIAGAIVNVAIAWAIATTVTPRLRMTVHPPPLSAWTQIDATTTPASLTPDEIRWLGNRNLRAWQSQTRFRDERICLGRRNIHYARSMNEYWRGMGVLRFDCGWPAHVLSGEGRGFSALEAPDEVIWPGFAINTVLYAAVLWLLFAAPETIRKRRRIQRGLCPKCAYPIGASEVCTECGAPVR